MAKSELVQELKKRASLLRLDVLEMLGNGKIGHVGGTMSMAELMAVLYFHQMKVCPENPSCPDRDIFIMAKGHCALIQYAALAQLGYFDRKHLATVKNLGSILQQHPDRNKTPGVEANTGSLGQGLSLSMGVALGMRLDNSPNRVYTILGDGEMAEGQVWEAVMAAAWYKLDNLIAIVDNNKLQATGFVKDILDINPMADKWRDFGWHTIEIDGHSVEEILDAFEQAVAVKGKPIVIIANTVKGKGISFAESVPGFHYNTLTPEQFEQAKKELGGVRE